MALAILGAALVLLFVLAYWRHSQTRPPLDRRDQIGVLVFFLVVGIPFLALSVALIARTFTAA
jgi:hypothetical protein